MGDLTNKKFLSTTRILLRAFVDEDLSDLEKIMSDSVVMKFTGFREPKPLDEVKELLGKWKLEGAGPLGVWCAQEKSSGDFAGWFMLKDTGHEFPELGFMVPQHKWGQGFATEVCTELINYAFNKLGHKKVIATTASENSSSISVLKKLGMEESAINLAKVDPIYKILSFEVLCDNP